MNAALICRGAIAPQWRVSFVLLRGFNPSYTSVMKYLLSFMALLFSLSFALPAEASDLIISRAVLEDSSTSLTIADVVHRRFAPMGFTLFKGYGRSAFWLRVKVRAPSQGDKVVLFIRQPFLSEIRLYEADAGQPLTWKTRVTGNYYAYAYRERGGSALSFIVKVNAPEATYYLRLKTTSPAQLSVDALTPAEADRRDSLFDLLEVFFATSMLALLVWAIHGYSLDRQAVMGLFAIHQAAYTLYGTSVMGYLAPLIPGDSPVLADWSMVFPYCAVNFTSLLFCRELFRPYAPPKLVMRGFKLLMLAFPLQLMLLALGHTAWAAEANSVLVRITWWYLVIATFTLRKEQLPSRRVLQVFFVTITLIFTAFWLSYHSSPTDTKSFLYGREVLIANGLIIGALFATILSARTRRLLREAQQFSSSLLLTRKTLELERKLKEEAEVQARTDFLTGLFNRRHWVELVERELLRSMRYQRPLTLLMMDIDHFKLVNDTWGHRVGDQVLQQISNVIRETLRNVDIFGRIGGEEFAASLIETDELSAIAVAERLRAAVADAVVVLEGRARVGVTISIGVSGLNGREIRFDHLMNEADQALYRAKQAGRNCVMASIASCPREQRALPLVTPDRG